MVTEYEIRVLTLFGYENETRVVRILIIFHGRPMFIQKILELFDDAVESLFISKNN